MSSAPRLRAAQYLQMSTEHQQYSLVSPTREAGFPGNLPSLLGSKLPKAAPSRPSFLRVSWRHWQSPFPPASRRYRRTEALA